MSIEKRQIMHNPLNDPHSDSNSKFLIGTEKGNVMLSFGDYEVLLTPKLARDISAAILRKADDAETYMPPQIDGINFDL
jgi:hypothetical protein